MKVHVYKITCITNLHVGNGDVNYSIVDNEVERDPVLGEAMIPSSGVKGALLSHARESGMPTDQIKEVFGSADGRGSYTVLSGNLLFRPIRVSEGEDAFISATSYELIDYYESLLKDLGIDASVGISREKGKTVTNSAIVSAEGIKAEAKTDNTKLSALCGGKWLITGEKNLGAIDLPVAARNRLSETGESQNLWYEEFVPHHAVFFTVIITPGEENKLDPYIDGKIVQFGANATIGFGLTKMEKLY